MQPPWGRDVDRVGCVPGVAARPWAMMCNAFGVKIGISSPQRGHTSKPRVAQHTLGIPGGQATSGTPKPFPRPVFGEVSGPQLTKEGDQTSHGVRKDAGIGGGIRGAQDQLFISPARGSVRATGLLGIGSSPGKAGSYAVSRADSLWMTVGVNEAAPRCSLYRLKDRASPTASAPLSATAATQTGPLAGEFWRARHFFIRCPVTQPEGWRGVRRRNPCHPPLLTCRL